MKKYCFLLLALTLVAACRERSPEPENFVAEVVEKYNAHNAIHYNVEYKTNFFSNDEPAIVNSEVFLVKNPEDSVFGGAFIFDRKTDTGTLLHKYYDGENVYIFNHRIKEKTVVGLSDDGASYIAGNLDGDVIETYFFNPERLLKNMEDSLNQITLADTIINAIPYMTMTIEYPDKEDITGMQHQYFFNRNDTTLERISFIAHNEKNTQVSEYALSDIAFNGFTAEDLSEKVAGYMTYEVYEPPKETRIGLLRNGTLAPAFSGRLYPDGALFQSKQLFGKVYILDFWFTACSGCIKAIPHLNELHLKYQDQIEIIGINPFNNKPEEEDKITPFLENNPVDYPILLTEREVPETYNVRGYPTFYVVDKNGVIRHSAIAYSKRMTTELTRVVEQLLGEE